MKVCVIEDDAIMLDHIAAMLVDMGCEVETALDVDSGLKKIAAFNPDAIVADILMPDRDGLNLIMDLRDKHDEIRIVAITGGGRLGAGPVLNMAKGLGAHATLVKPFSQDELRGALQLA